MMRAATVSQRARLANMNLTVEASGFAKHVQTGVSLPSIRTAVVDVSMKLKRCTGGRERR